MKKSIFLCIYFTLFTCMQIFAQSNSEQVFTKKTRRPSNLSIEMNRKLDKFERDTNSFKKLHYISVGNIKTIQKNNKLTVHIPSTGKPITFKAKRVETYSDEDYTWYGEDESDGYASITIQNKNGLYFGYIKTIDEVSEIYGLLRGESVVLDKKKVTQSFCNSERETNGLIEQELYQVQQSVNTLCIGPPKIRVLFVTDDDSRASVPDINQTALNCIQAFNNSLASTSITNQTARLIFAGMLNLNSFSENLSNPNGDMDIISALSSNMRESTAADVVVFLTSFNYVPNGTSVDGTVRQVEASANTAFAIVKADKAVNDRHTFSHEIGHLFGGLHRPVPGSTPPPGLFAFGNCFRAGPNFLSKKSYETIMSSNCFVTAIDKFSSPNATLYGTPTGSAERDVARKINERASTMGDFRTDIGALALNLNGDTYLQPFQSYTYIASPQCESGDVNFTWEVSSDGFNFYNVLSGVGQSNYSFYYNPYTFTNTVIRVTITDGLGRTATSFLYLQLSGSPMIAGGGKNDKSATAYSTKMEATAYPNPSNGDNLIVEFKLNEDSKEVTIELVNNEGKVISNILKKGLGEGSYSENMDIKNIPNGFYLLKTSIDGNPIFNKIVISK